MRSQSCPRILYYDPLERLVKTINPNKTYSEVKYQPWYSISYDEEDVVPDGKHYDTPKEMTYDAYGRLTQVTEYASKDKIPIATRYSYDLNDNLIKITDATGKEANERHFIYDLLGRQLYQYEPNSGAKVYFYDQNSNLIYRRDNKGQWIRSGYDSLNRLTKKYYLKDDGPQIVVSNTYETGEGENLKGRLAKVVDLSGNTEFSYNARGQILRKIRQLNGLEPNFVTEYRYDSMNRVNLVSYPDANRTIVPYEYDGGNHLECIPGYVDEITYNAKRQRLNIKYANGVRTEYSYEPLTFRLQNLKTTSNGGIDGDLQNLLYTYDNVGNILTIEDISPQASQQKYDYDSCYRIVLAKRTAAVGYDINYGYDKIGNITQKSDLSSDILQYNLDGRPNTLDHYGDTALYYDNNGNLQKTPEIKLHWDFEDRLTNIEKTDGTVATYIYDASGIRTMKRVQTGSNTTLVCYVDDTFEIRNGMEKLYIFDDENRIASVNDSHNITYFHSDYLGSTDFLSNEAGQMLGERFIYAPYGRIIQNSSDTDYGFIGKERDNESGLNYFRARYYNSIFACFITADPLYLTKTEDAIDTPAKLNLYSYTLGNPFRYVDPNGLRPTQTAIKNEWLLFWAGGSKSWSGQCRDAVWYVATQMLGGKKGGKPVYSRSNTDKEKSNALKRGKAKYVVPPSGTFDICNEKFENPDDKNDLSVFYLIDYIELGTGPHREDQMVIYQGDETAFAIQKIPIKPGMLIEVADSFRTCGKNKKCWARRHTMMYGGNGIVYEEFNDPSSPRNLSCLTRPATYAPKHRPRFEVVISIYDPWGR